MTVTLAVPALVSLLGVVLYASTDGKLSEIGRIAYAFGLLVTLMHLR